MAEIGIGTVQFGLNYGINNSSGKPSIEQVRKILARADQSGISILDTAAAYGDSEEVIGEILSDEKWKFDIVSKLPPGTKSADVGSAFETSSKKLKRSQFYGYLIHHYRDWQDDPKIWDEMMRLKQNGRVKKVGVSLYHPSEARNLWAKKVNFDLVQVPYSIFDQRFDEVFEEMKLRGVEIHVRSIFLQGLFFKKPENLQAFFHPVKGKIKSLHELSVSCGLSIASLCLGFGLIHRCIDKVVVGVDREKDLLEDLKVVKKKREVEALKSELKALRVDDERIILPIHWD